MRIQAEKAKLIAQGKIKKEKSLSLIGDDEKPFELPTGWKWVKVGEIGEIGGIKLGRQRHQRNIQVQI